MYQRSARFCVERRDIVTAAINGQGEFQVQISGVSTNFAALRAARQSGSVGAPEGVGESQSARQDVPSGDSSVTAPAQTNPSDQLVATALTLLISLQEIPYDTPLRTVHGS